MSNGELSLLNDYENTTRLSRTQSSQYLRLQLQYIDRQKGLEKLQNAQFLPTTTIRDVIKELLKLINLEHIRPEDVNLVELIQHKRSHVPVETIHMTLHDLNIEDGCILSFQPSLTSVAEAPSCLRIWGPNTAGRVYFKWYKITTTLGDLLEHVIQKFSLESVDRERIHLFYELEELNLSLNYDKLLGELGIRDNAFIDVEMIPPLSPLISSSNNRTTNGLLLYMDGQNVIDRSLHTKSSSLILLELQYTDRFEDIAVSLSGRFSPTITIYDLIEEFLKRNNLKHIHSEDVKLAEFGHGKERSLAPIPNKSKTLKELEIEDGFTLYFEPTFSSSPDSSLNLIIYRPNGLENVIYKWCKTSTTLGTLCEYIFQVFSLQSIERRRIQLTIGLNKQLDHMSNYNKLLSDLGIVDNDSIKIEITPSQCASTTSVNQNVHIHCTYTNGTQSLDVPITITIAELRKQIEKQFKDHLVTDLKLFNRMHDIIDMNNSTQTLSYFSIKPGEIVYARLDLVFSRNPLSKLNMEGSTTTRSSSLIAKSQPDEVTVVCKVSTNAPTHIKASVNDTVADILKALETFKKNRSFAKFDIWCGSNNIDPEQSSRRLSDFGVLPGDTINATLIERIPISYKLETSHGSTSLMLDHSSRNQWYTLTPPGLANLGNTCYMNSALQCLAHAKPLTQFFLDGLTQDGSEHEKGLAAEWNQFYTAGAVTGAYADVLRNLWLPSKNFHSFGSYRPNHIKETIGLQAPRFATYDQQDAQEFMTYLLDEIHKELKEKNGNESSTTIEELFFGKIQSTVTCLDCQHQVKTTNIISFLPLPLSQQGYIFTVRFIGKDGKNDIVTVSVPENGQVRSILEAFVEARRSQLFFDSIIVITDDGQLDLDTPLDQLFVREVMLVEQEDFLGSSIFDQMFKTSKKLTLEDCLRYFFSLENLEDSWLCQQETCKKHTKATKQLQLCSLPPILIIQFKRFAHDNGLRQKIETFVEYPIKKLDLSSFLSSSVEEAIYDLFAVCNHSGSIYGGHYIACALHEANGKSSWYKFDDAYVSTYCSESDIVSKDAYLLFYIKRDTPKQSTVATTS